MKKSTVFLAVYFLIITVFSLCIDSIAALNTAEIREDIVVLYTNDVHCGINDKIGYDGLALYKKEMERTHDNVLLVDTGDTIQGDVIGAVSRGEGVISLMNELSYDAATVGNHEFDYGVERLEELSSKLSCGFVCCNYFDKNGELIYKPYNIIKAGEKKIAFVGAVTPRTFTTSPPALFKNSDGDYTYSFSQNGKELYKSVQKSADAAREEGADIVILLSHLGEINHGYFEWSAQEVVRHTDNIDAVIDAHSHSVTEKMIEKNKNGKNVIISQTGTKLEKIGKMTITKENNINTTLISEVPAPREDMDISDNEWLSLPERGGRNVDRDMYNKVNSELKKISEKLNVVVGFSDFDLTISNPETGSSAIKNAETNLGDLCADYLKDYCGADIGLINGGAIRTSIPKGGITVGSIYKLLSSLTHPSTAVVKGQQILDYLELGAKSYPEEDGFFAQVSGLSYEIDENVESSVILDEYGEFLSADGERRVKNVYLSDGSALNPEKFYKIASTENLLRSGGDAGIFSKSCYELSIGEKNDYICFSDYIRETLGGVIPEKYNNPNGEGRITLTEKWTAPSETDIVNWSAR